MIFQSLKKVICALQIDVYKEKFSVTPPSPFRKCSHFSEWQVGILTVHFFHEDTNRLAKYHMVNKSIGSHVKKVLAQRLALPLAIFENFNSFYPPEISVSSCKMRMINFTYVIRMLYKLCNADIALIIVTCNKYQKN